MVGADNRAGTDSLEGVIVEEGSSGALLCVGFAPVQSDRQLQEV
jgi:hypothetical protein